MNNSGVYQIINLVNGKCYIGSTVNFKRRFTRHKSELRSGVHYNQHLQNSWNKYGEAAFECRIIESVERPAGLSDREWDLLLRKQYEQQWINKLKPEYNACPAADSHLGIKRSEETKAKMSVAMTGKKHSPETCEKIRLLKTGLKDSPETRAKKSAALMGNTHTLGYNPSAETREKLRIANTGQTRSAEVRAKMSEAQKGNKKNLGKTRTAETKAKMSASQKGRVVSAETRAKMAEAAKLRCQRQREMRNHDMP